MAQLEQLLIGIGDLHGHFPAFGTLLYSLDQQYNIFADQKDFVLRDDVKLVFTGDYIDRGDKGLMIIEKLQELSQKNPGKIVTLSGNHELMALEESDVVKEILGDMKYSKLKDVNEVYTEYLTRGMARGMSHGHNGGTEFLKEFGDNPQELLENYVQRMANDGDIGKWLRKLEPLYQTNFAGKRILFNHADLPEKLDTDTQIKKWTGKYRRAMEMPTVVHGGTDHKFGNRDLIIEGGLFWSRRYGHLTPGQVDQLMENLKLDYMVCAHTPHDKIVSYGDRIFNIDVGMNKGNDPAAIVFKNDGIYGFYVEQGEHKVIDF
jgi:hypothetical protein